MSALALKDLETFPSFLLIDGDSPTKPFRYDHIYDGAAKDNFRFDLHHYLDSLDKRCNWVAYNGDEPTYLYVQYLETEDFAAIRTLRDSIDNNIKYELKLDVYSPTGEDAECKVQGRFMLESITTFIGKVESKNPDLLGMLTHYVTFKRIP